MRCAEAMVLSGLVNSRVRRRVWVTGRDNGVCQVAGIHPFANVITNSGKITLFVACVKSLFAQSYPLEVHCRFSGEHLGLDERYL